MHTDLVRGGCVLTWLEVGAYWPGYSWVCTDPVKGGCILPWLQVGVYWPGWMWVCTDLVRGGCVLTWLQVGAYWPGYSWVCTDPVKGGCILPWLQVGVYWPGWMWVCTDLVGGGCVLLVVLRATGLGIGPSIRTIITITAVIHLILRYGHHGHWKYKQILWSHLAAVGPPWTNHRSYLATVVYRGAYRGRPPSPSTIHKQILWSYLATVGPLWTNHGRTAVDPPSPSTIAYSAKSNEYYCSCLLKKLSIDLWVRVQDYHMLVSTLKSAVNPNFFPSFISLSQDISNTWVRV